MTGRTREQYGTRWLDYYEVLQVHPRAEQEVITAAYRKLAFLYHPDRNKGAGATERLKLINEAYAILSDKSRRARYDEFSAARSSRTEDRSDRTSSGFSEPKEADGWERAWNDDDYAPDYETAPQPDYEYGAPGRVYHTGTWSRVESWFRARPEETGLILPWLSKRSQVSLLVVSIVMSVVFVGYGIAQAAAGFPQEGMSLIVVGLVLTTCGVYGGVATDWLRRTRQASLGARIAGGTSIAVGGAVAAFAAIYVLVIVAILVFTVAVTCAMARSYLEKS